MIKLQKIRNKFIMALPAVAFGACQFHIDALDIKLDANMVTDAGMNMSSNDSGTKPTDLVTSDLSRGCIVNPTGAQSYPNVPIIYQAIETSCKNIGSTSGICAYSTSGKIENTNFGFWTLNLTTLDFVAAADDKFTISDCAGNPTSAEFSLPRPINSTTPGTSINFPYNGVTFTINEEKRNAPTGIVIKISSQ